MRIGAGVLGPKTFVAVTKRVFSRLGRSTDGREERAVAVGHCEGGTPPAGDDDVAVGPRNPADDESRSVSGGNRHRNQRRRKRIWQWMIAKDCIDNHVHVLLINDAIFVQVPIRQQGGRKQVRAVDVVDQTLEVDDRGAAIFIEIAKALRERGQIRGTEKKREENERQTPVRGSHQAPLARCAHEEVREVLADPRAQVHQICWKILAINSSEGAVRAD